MSGTSRRLPIVLQRPPQGWSSLALLLGLLALVGVSVGEARLLTADQEGVGASLVLIMVAATLGCLLARSSLGVVRSHLIGAAVGAGLILLVAGSAMQERAAVVPGSWQDLLETMSFLYGRVQDDIQATEATVGYIPAVVSYLLLAAVCWTTAQFSAFSVFRYDRGGPAVVAIGIVLVLNLSLASWRADAELLPILPQLALFAGLAMLLLMRLQLTHQRDQWARRHIADTGEVSRLFLRTGVLFVAFAVVGASSLTLAATTGPHELSTDDFEELFGDVGSDLSGLLAFLNVPIGSDQPSSLDDSFTIPESWQPGDGIAFTAQVDGDLAGNYWWMSASDAFDGWTWRNTESRSVRPDGDFELTPGEGQPPFRSLRATVSVQDLPFARNVVSPADAYAVSEPVELELIDGNDSVGMVRFRERSVEIEEYDVSALVRRYGDRPGALTARALRSAGDDYPRWVRERYLQGAGDPAITAPLTRETADRIKRAGGNAYDRAVAIQDELRAMTYTVDLEGICDGLNAPECVLTHGRGFCQYYASTMAMVLREMDIPSRMVRGFLPGELASDGSWQVENQAFHAWVEAYFPGYGWIRFDPTPGASLARFGQEGTALESGGPSPSQPPEPIEDPPIEPLPSAADEVAESPAADLEQDCLGGCPGSDDDGAVAALIVGGGMAGLLLFTIGGLFLITNRPSMADEGLAYRSLVRLATRLGHGPHPAQTEYEYASTLSSALPAVRDELFLVTTSRVAASYGRRTLEDEARPALRRAYRRIRTALLRLSLRVTRPR